MPRYGDEWRTEEHAASYRERADGIPHREEGEAVILELLPSRLRRVLDLGTGDGRLLGLIREHRDGVDAVGLDFSPPMLEAARERFEGTAWIVEHDLDRTLPELGTFDAVVSSFAIHHLPDERKRAIYEEVYGVLEPGGVFVNLEHVASPTLALKQEFQVALGLGRDWEDPSNRLAPVEPQLEWMRAIGFDDVDCLWKWRELALLHGRKPT